MRPRSGPEVLAKLRPTLARRAAAAALLLAASSGPAPAHETEELGDLPLEELVRVKVATVRGASKHEQRVTEAPASVSIVTAEEIRRFGYRTLGDLLNGVRGFYVTNDRNYGYVGVRGLNRPGDFGGRVLLLVDGHRLNEPIFDSAFNQNDFVLDLDLVERVEIVRGPGSSLYGNNAFFAVVDVITRKAASIDGVELSGAIGNQDRYQGRATVGRTLENGLDVVLSGSWISTEGEREIFFPELAGEPGGGRVEDQDGDASGSAWGSFAWRGFSLRGGYVRREKEVPTGAFGAVLGDPAFETLDERAFASIEHERKIGEALVEGRLYYDLYRYEADYPVPGVLNRDRVEAEWWGGELSVSGHPVEGHHATLGAAFRDDFRLDQGNFDVDPRVVFADIERDARSFAFFLQDELRVLPSVMLNLGVRFDHFSTFGSTWSPRLAAIWQPLDGTSVKALYGRAFRAPNGNEFFYVSSTQRANRDLDAERITSHELVLEQYLPQGIRLVGLVFLNRIDDLIDQREDDDGLLVFENDVDLESRGLGLEIEGRFGPGVLARAGYSLQRTEDRRSEDEITNSPRHLVKGQLGIPFLDDRLGLGLEVLSSSSVGTLGGRRAGAYVLFHATLTAELWPDFVEGSFDVRNLLDDQYDVPGAGEHRQDVLPQVGRTWRAKLTVRF